MPPSPGNSTQEESCLVVSIVAGGRTRITTRTFEEEPSPAEETLENESSLGRLI